MKNLKEHCLIKDSLIFCDEKLGVKDGKCINCMSKGEFRLLTGTLCIDRIKNTYIVDEEYGIIDTCYESCATCNN